MEKQPQPGLEGKCSALEPPEGEAVENSRAGKGHQGLQLTTATKLSSDGWTEEAKLCERDDERRSLACRLPCALDSAIIENFNS